ncbi:MAG: PD-(D/E)XK nuclease family protein [Desulfonatronovibrionaceae bacterium]
MPFAVIEESQALEKLESRALLLTSNNRLARELGALYAGYRRSQGANTWETPAIMPLSSCLVELYSRLSLEMDLPFLLSPDQELILWERIIEENPPRTLFPSRDLARMARRSWMLCRRWGLAPKDMHPEGDRENEAFVSWGKAFMDKCATQNWLEQSALAWYMADLLEEKAGLIPEEVIVCGFLEFDPSQERIFSVFRERSCRLYNLSRSREEGKGGKLSFADPDQELEAAAAWAEKEIKTKKASNVAVIIPDLERVRSRVVRIFDRILQPEKVLSLTPGSAPAYNISMGTPLAGYQIVDHACLLLAIPLQRVLNTAELGRVLVSPFVRGEEELCARAILDREIREKREHWIKSKMLERKLAEAEKRGECLKFAASLRAARDVFNLPSEVMTLGEWARIFASVLQAWGWPGDRTVSSREYQTIRAFREVLSELAGLDAVSPRTDFATALDYLRRILSERIFQPRSPAAGIQVMGLFEAVGQAMDKIWLAGMTADVLPGRADPDPFIPVRDQRRLFMPGSCPERELEMAGRIWENMRLAAGEIVCSYPRAEEDTEIIPSPFVIDLPDIDPQEVLAHMERSALWQHVRQGGGVEEGFDSHGLPLADLSPAGGTAVFRDQAVCPFKGYAQARLKTEEPQSPVPGLGPAERGEMVHRALWTLWQELNSRDGLLEMNEGELLRLVTEIAEQTAGLWISPESLVRTKKYLRLEALRLKDILMSWLEVEKDRPFFQIRSLEERTTVSIGGLKIKVRSDRADTLESGAAMLIDYKTGASLPSAAVMWMEERMIEPQLPVYAVHMLQEELSVVCVARVNPRNMEFLGIADSRAELPLTGKMKTVQEFGFKDMKEVLNSWRERLEQLAEEIKSGYGPADPVQASGYAFSCRRCRLKPLCRINEALPGEEVGFEGEMADG